MIRIKGKEVREARVFTTIMLLLVLAVVVSSFLRARRIGKISYQDHMDDIAVTIDGVEHTFRDLAFYLAYQEMITENQAKIYDLDHTSKYWNVHANGSFLRLEAKDQALHMAVHDEIFYQMALLEDVELTPDEIVYIENESTDFWNDLEEEGQMRLGISVEEIEETFLRMGLAQKQQKELADDQGVDDREYDVNGSKYQELLKAHTFEVNEDLWDRLNFGKIILD